MSDRPPGRHVNFNTFQSSSHIRCNLLSSKKASAHLYQVKPPRIRKRKNIVSDVRTTSQAKKNLHSIDSIAKEMSTMFKFKIRKCSMRVPFVVYADFEACTKPISSFEPSSEKSSQINTRNTNHVTSATTSFA